MGRAFCIYSLLLLVPGIVLAYAALHLAGGERDEALRLLGERSREEADRIGRALESALKDALETARVRKGIPAFLSADGTLQYSDKPASGDRQGESRSQEARHYFNRSIQGGESFEFEEGDPGRAMDAYAFYLPRIPQPDLRARLRYRIARCALADNRRALAAALYRSLVRESHGVCTGEGLPIDLLSGLRLLDLQADMRHGIRKHLVERLSNGHQHLSTSFMTYMMRHAEISDPFLERILSGRKALEHAMKMHQPHIEKNGIALHGETLLAIGNEDKGLRPIYRAPVKWPSLDGGNKFKADFYGNRPANDDVPEGAAVRPVGLEGHPLPAGCIHVHDLQYKADRQRIARLHFWGCLMVVTAIMATLAGGFALVRFVGKERRLARLRNRLITNVSHELKSPVTAIRLFSDLLTEESLDKEKVHRFGRLLRSESMRLSQLVDNLLDFSRIGRKEAALELEPVDIGGVVNDVAESFAYRAQEKKVKFSVDVAEASKGDENGAYIAMANAEAVQRIILNFLDNALKYCRVQGPSILLKARREAERIVVLVRDNGPGIARSEQEKIFEPFFRVHYDDYGVRGSGLGLSLARALARKMDGAIKLESKTGGGSTFILELPAGECTETQTEDSAPKETRGGSA